jgi:hypothetical protein
VCLARAGARAVGDHQAPADEVDAMCEASDVRVEGLPLAAKRDAFVRQSIADYFDPFVQWQLPALARGFASVLPTSWLKGWSVSALDLQLALCAAPEEYVPSPVTMARGRA